MEFGMSRRIKPKEKYVRISMKEIWRNLDGPPKNKELWSYVVSFEFSRPKVAPKPCTFFQFYTRKIVVQSNNCHDGFNSSNCKPTCLRFIRNNCC